jgi:hypothetical protein
MSKQEANLISVLQGAALGIMIAVLASGKHPQMVVLPLIILALVLMDAWQRK